MGICKPRVVVIHRGTDWGPVGVGLGFRALWSRGLKFNGFGVQGFRSRDLGVRAQGFGSFMGSLSLYIRG